MRRECAVRSSGFCPGHQVRTVGEESGDFRRRALHRKIGGIEDRERRAAHQSDDSVDLPVAERLLIPSVWLSPERQAPLIAQHKPVTGIEQRTTALGSEIEGILRKIILAGHWLGRRTSHVERRSVINGFRVGVRREKREAVTEAFGQAGLQRVVRRIGDALDRARWKSRCTAAT